MNIHLNGAVWTWTMPSSAHVLIRDPQRKKTVVNPCHVIQGWFEAAKAKDLHLPKHSYNGRDGMNITPAMVKVYIEKNLLQKAGK